MGFFDKRSRRRRAVARTIHKKMWWETAAEFPPDELFYDPVESAYDPMGSYTGNPADGGEPEQDVDDL